MQNETGVLPVRERAYHFIDRLGKPFIFLPWKLSAPGWSKPPSLFAVLKVANCPAAAEPMSSKLVFAGSRALNT